MLKLRTFLIASLLIIFTVDVVAQRWLAYGKHGKEKFRIRLGDEVTFRISGDKIHVSGTLDEITQEYVVVSGEWIPIDRIDQIVVTEPFEKLQRRANGMIGSGISALISAMLNNWINRNGKILDPATLYVSGSITGLGLLLKPFRARRFRVGGNRKIWVIDVW